MKILLGSSNMREVGFADDRYVDVVSMDNKISVRIIIDNDRVTVLALSGTMTIQNNHVYPSVKIEKV